MNEFEFKYNPGYEYLNDSEIKKLQLLLDEYVAPRNKSDQVQAYETLPDAIRKTAASCEGSNERIRLFMKFLQDNIRFNFAGGIGKDIHNPVIKAISDTMQELANRYPEIFNSLK